MSVFEHGYRRSPEYLHSSGSSESPPPQSADSATRLTLSDHFVPHPRANSRHTPTNTSPRSTSAMSNHSQEAPREYHAPESWRPSDMHRSAPQQQPSHPSEPHWNHPVSAGYPGPEWMAPTVGIPPYMPNQFQQAPNGNMAQQGQPPRQRTSIACRYCRKRKIRCSGYSNNPGGKCINCTRMNQECVFQPVNSNNNAAAFVHISALGGNFPTDMPVYGAYGQQIHPVNPLPPSEAFHRGEPPSSRPPNAPPHERIIQDRFLEEHGGAGNPYYNGSGRVDYPGHPRHTTTLSASRPSPPTTHEREPRMKSEWPSYPNNPVEDDRRSHALPPISDHNFPSIEGSSRESERPGVMRLSHLLDSPSDVDRHMLNRLGRGGRM